MRTSLTVHMKSGPREVHVGDVIQHYGYDCETGEYVPRDTETILEIRDYDIRIQQATRIACLPIQSYHNALKGCHWTIA